MNSTTKILAAFGLAACFSFASSDAALLVYEGFDYAVGDLESKNGGTGFSAGWEDMTAGSNAGLPYVYDSNGITVPRVGGGPDLPDWDGVVDNLAQTGGYVGLSPNSNDSFEDRINARRGLAQSAGAMAGPDGVLWASAVYHFEDNRFNFAPGFLLTDGGGLSERSRDLTDSSDGIGVAHGFAWGNDLNAAAYNDSTGERTTGVNISTTEDNVVVMKFEFGATDSVSTWFFTESQVIDEATFDANAITHTLSFDIDENALDTLTIGITRAGNGYDEIRIGDTFADVTPIPEPSTLALLGLGGLCLLMRRR